MTRINVNIKANELPRQLLLAEHREMVRIPNTIASGKARVENIPDKFTLGKGHVKFFYDKLAYLLNRYKNVHQECLKRGYNVQDYSSAWDNIPSKLMNDYTPTLTDRVLLIQRIESKGFKLLN